MVHEKFVETFAHYLIHQCRVRSKDHGIVAVSGGGDSTLLLCLLADLRAKLNLKLRAVVVDHGLRLEAAIEREEVRRLGEELGIQVGVVSVDVKGRALADRRSVEEAARLERREALERERSDFGASWIAMGHTLSDRAETVLLRLRRGTGLLGLGNMEPRRMGLIRPLLWASREAVRQELLHRGRAWSEDRSNFDRRFERSRLRLEVMPSIDERAAVVLAERARAAQEFLDGVEAAWLCGRVFRWPGGLYLQTRDLCDLPVATVARLLRRCSTEVLGAPLAHSRAVTGELVSFVRQGRGPEVHLPGMKVRRLEAGGAFVFSVHPAPVSGERVSIARPGRYRLDSLATTVIVGEARTLSPIWGRMPLRGSLEVRGRLPGDRLVLKKRSIKRLWDRIGLWQELRDWVPMIAEGREVLWTAVNPSAAEPGVLVSFVLDVDHPLRMWIRHFRARLPRRSGGAD